MSDKKDVKLTDLEAEGAEDVKGGAAAPTQTFATVNVSGVNATISSQLINQNQLANLNKIKDMPGSTAMCLW